MQRAGEYGGDLGIATHRSVSQVQQYLRCPYSYYLAREVKVPQTPAAWLVQGSAFHETVEMWERTGRGMPVEDVMDWYGRAYERETQSYCEQVPDLGKWFGSGPYRAPEDLGRRYGLGLAQVERYLAWARATENTGGRHPWVLDRGYVAVEVPFEVSLGPVLVRGYVDKIDDLGSGRLRAVDYKTGNKPGSDFQLETYIVAMWLQYGLLMSGSFWMARTGKETTPIEPTHAPIEEITSIFETVDTAIRQEEFQPHPSEDNCRFCSVAPSCEYRYFFGQ